MTAPILHILSGDLWGGAEVQMMLQIGAQRDLGLDARALVFNEAQTSQRYLESKIPVQIILESGGWISLISAARRYVREIRPSLIVAHGYKETFLAAILKALEGVHFVSTFHGLSESYGGVRRLKMAIYDFAHRALSRHYASETVVVTEHMSEELGFPTSVIGNVCEVPKELSEVEFEEIRRAAFGEAKRAIVIVGRLVPVKRIDRAIEAISILKRLNSFETPILYVVGEGELEEELRCLTHSLNVEDNVKFLGFRLNAREIIRAADLLLLTSESEGFPTVVAEAMVAGVPMVLSDLPSFRELLQRFRDYPAYLVNDHSAQNFAITMADILKSGPLKGQQRVSPVLLEEVRNSFSPIRAARESKNLYEKLSSYGYDYE